MHPCQKETLINQRQKVKSLAFFYVHIMKKCHLIIHTFIDMREALKFLDREYILGRSIIRSMRHHLCLARLHFKKVGMKTFH